MADLTLEQLVQSYKHLHAQVKAGGISLQQFQSQVRSLRGRDSSGAWWAANPDSGEFLRHDGRQWVAAQPPVGPQAGSLAAAPARRSGCAGITSIMGVFLSVIVAVLWFVWTSLTGSSEGNDLLTPLIIAGIPVGLWVFKKQVDQLLLPLQPRRQAIPRPILVGISLGLPIMLGIVCSSTGGGGFGMLRLLAIVSMLTAHALLRNPEVQS
jgi:hypothetical protein